jgi:hypothetical protein
MELKPCPFCDGEAYQPDEGVYVWCSNRNCIGTNAVGNTDEWNTRPIEDELNARIKELERQVRAYTILAGYDPDRELE